MVDDFIAKIRDQLKVMTAKEKDAWILSQAKILTVSEQEAFYRSLCGDRRVIRMPERSEITAFCEKVRNGDLHVEYETHYVEFDEDGYYHDDWEHDFYDPHGAMNFIESVIRGCHDLIVLEEYRDAFEILDDIIRLKFVIEDSPNTDDPCQDEWMDLDMAVEEEILSLDRDDLLRDYILSCRQSCKDDRSAAEKLIDAFEMPLFEECQLCLFINISEKDPLLKELKKKLAEELDQYRKELDDKSTGMDYLRQFRERKLVARLNALAEYFERIGKPKEKPAESFLRGTWAQISGLLRELEDEPYIDDQNEINEIYEIVEALLKRGRFGEEPWEVKKHILQEIYENDYYEYYGVYDPMKELANAICSTREENLLRAQIMMKAGRGEFGAEAAKLYRELGEEDKCAEYFEVHLGKEEEPYRILVEYYKERDHRKAVEYANQAIQKCKKDQTYFFLFLLQDAQERGDDAAFRKLMQSAHRRRAVKSEEVEAMFNKERQP